MKREKYQELKSYMQECMSDAAHDKEHVWRVLGYALRLAAELKEPVDHDLLIAACLLHDIGRAAQFRDPSLDHAAVGADMAAGWLSDHGYSPGFCQAVRSAIRSHRYRTGGRAESIEAQLLFDADKLDVCGIMGLLRTVSYCDHVGEPYYTVGENGLVEFTADSDAIIVKGIISMLIDVLSGHTPQEILDADLYFIDRIGLREHLSTTRSNGLVAMVRQIHDYARAFKIMNEDRNASST